MRRLLLHVAMHVAGHFFHVLEIVVGQVVDLGPQQVDDPLARLVPDAFARTLAVLALPADFLAFVGVEPFSSAAGVMLTASLKSLWISMRSSASMVSAMIVSSSRRRTREGRAVAAGLAGRSARSFAAPQTEMGPGIAAEPHCAEREITGLRFRPKLHPEGKASAFHDPCALAQASRRSRSAARSPELFPEASAPAQSCDLRFAFTPALPALPGSVKRQSEDFCFPHHSAPTVPILASASIPLHSEERMRVPSLGPVLDPLLSLSLASQFQPESPPTVRSRPFLGSSSFALP